MNLWLDDQSQNWVQNHNFWLVGQLQRSVTKEEIPSWWVTWQAWYLAKILAGSPWMQQPVRVGTESTACMICCCHKCSSNNCLLWFSPWLREPKPNQLRQGSKLCISSNIGKHSNESCTLYLWLFWQIGPSCNFV